MPDNDSFTPNSGRDPERERQHGTVDTPPGRSPFATAGSRSVGIADTSGATSASISALVLECGYFEDISTLRGCIRNALARSTLDGTSLGSVLCALTPNNPAYEPIALEVLASWADTDLLGNCVAARASCSDRFLGDLLVRGLLQFSRDNPAILAAVITDLDGFRLFSQGASPFLLDVTAAFSREYGDAALRYLLEEGGRGILGGDLTQVDYSIMKAVSLQRNDFERFEFISGVLHSPAIRIAGATESGIGASLTYALLQGDARSENDGIVACQLLHSAFADPTFGPGAAAQFVRYGSREHPATWAPLQEWHLLWDRASEVVKSSGIEFN